MQTIDVPQPAELPLNCCTVHCWQAEGSRHLIATYKTRDGALHELRTSRIVLACGFRLSHSHFVPVRCVTATAAAALPATPIVSPSVQRLGSKREDAPAVEAEPTLQLVMGRPANAAKDIPVGKRLLDDEVFFTGTTCGTDIVDPYVASAVPSLPHLNYYSILAAMATCCILGVVVARKMFSSFDRVLILSAPHGYDDAFAGNTTSMAACRWSNWVSARAHKEVLCPARRTDPRDQKQLNGDRTGASATFHNVLQAVSAQCQNPVPEKSEWNMEIRDFLSHVVP